LQYTWELLETTSRSYSHVYNCAFAFLTCLVFHLRYVLNIFCKISMQKVYTCRLTSSHLVFSFRIIFGIFKSIYRIYSQIGCKPVIYIFLQFIEMCCSTRGIPWRFNCIRWTTSTRRSNYWDQWNWYDMRSSCSGKEFKMSSNIFSFLSPILTSIRYQKKKTYIWSEVSSFPFLMFKNELCSWTTKEHKFNYILLYYPCWKKLTQTSTKLDILFRHA
jgi:hypothetical protein